MFPRLEDLKQISSGSTCQNIFCMDNFCRYSLKLEKNWPNFLVKFQFMLILIRDGVAKDDKRQFKCLTKQDQYLN